MTVLDMLLNKVEYAKHELTIDVRGYTPQQIKRVEISAQARGFDVASDGKHMLIRALKRHRTR